MHRLLRSIFLVSLFFQTSLLSETSASEKRTLQDAFQSARVRSEGVLIQKELYQQSLEIAQQAKSTLYPSINGYFTYLQQAVPSSAAASNFFPGSQTTARVNVVQPLFKGLRDFAAIRQKEALAQSQDLQTRSTERLLYYDIATAYYLRLSLEKDESNYLKQLEFGRKRLSELEGFVRIGRSKLTDALSLKANIASLEAQLEQIRGQLEVARANFTYFTGWGADLPLDHSDSGTLSGLASVKSLSSYLEGIERRIEVRLALSNADGIQEGVGIAKGFHLPSVDFIGNYYVTRPGALSDVNWDFQLALTIPIYQGGSVSSQVRQANSAVRQADLSVLQARRQGEQEIRNFFNTVISDREQLKKLKDLVSLSGENLKEEVAEYRNGLVTNLEVLQATTVHQEAQRQFEHLLCIAQGDLAKLRAASGQVKELEELRKF